MKEEGMKPVKSIDTDKNQFIKDEKKKYYHTDCYKLHLAKRFKLTEEEIQQKLDERLEVTIKEVEEAAEKDLFLKWIMDFYDGSLPSFFLKKLQSVRDGSHEGINEPITYDTLLDIYKQMEKYLRKVAAHKNIKKVPQQMNYDLAVVIGNYGDYKKYISQQKLDIEKAANAIKTVDDQKKIETAITKKKESDEQGFNLSDVLDDILL